MEWESGRQSDRVDSGVGYDPRVGGGALVRLLQLTTRNNTLKVEEESAASFQ